MNKPWMTKWWRNKQRCTNAQTMNKQTNERWTMNNEQQTMIKQWTNDEQTMNERR
jgi:hypothetical protein